MRFDITDQPANVGHEVVAKVIADIARLPDDDPRKHMTALVITPEQRDDTFKDMTRFHGYPLVVKST